MARSSWGDNELSPECLDGAIAYLKEGGISIPADYTSFAAPLSSSKLWNEVKAFGDRAHFETPYVVKVHSLYSTLHTYLLYLRDALRRQGALTLLYSTLLTD